MKLPTSFLDKVAKKSDQQTNISLESGRKCLKGFAVYEMIV
jgi:hypothetical protein